MGSPYGSAGKESACKAGDPGSIPGLGRSWTGEGKGYPLQNSGLENSMDCIVHEVAWIDLVLENFKIRQKAGSFYRIKNKKQGREEWKISSWLGHQGEPDLDRKPSLGW